MSDKATVIDDLAQELHEIFEEFNEEDFEDEVALDDLNVEEEEDWANDHVADHVLAYWNL